MLGGLLGGVDGGTARRLGLASLRAIAVLGLASRLVGASRRGTAVRLARRAVATFAGADIVGAAATFGGTFAAWARNSRYGRRCRAIASRHHETAKDAGSQHDHRQRNCLDHQFFSLLLNSY